MKGPIQHFGTYVFDQSALVLKSVTLAQMVQLVVKVLVNLSRGAVFHKKTTEYAKTTHP